MKKWIVSAYDMYVASACIAAETAEEAISIACESGVFNKAHFEFFDSMDTDSWDAEETEDEFDEPINEPETSEDE